MPFKMPEVDPRTGKGKRLKRIKPNDEIPESQFCGLCADTGVVEDGAFCSCSKGQSLKREEFRLPKPKTSSPPKPTDDQKSAFDKSNLTGTQLDLFQK